ncbi:MAG: quinone oxidoreductase [bacterium]|nr:quinone oxidoreductase [bacterium]
MRATVIRNLGGPEVLVTEDVDDPVAGSGEVVVEIAGAGLNFIDTYHRTGLYPVELPFTPGLEAAGRVVSIGSGVEGLSSGDRVAFCSRLGAYSERTAIPADQLVPVPEAVSLDTAAALMVQGLTALYLATETYSLEDGSTCLIHAGAGGVGLILTQMAKQLGATVFTTVGSDAKAEISRAAGADHVIVYSREDFGDRVREIGGERPLDVIYDGVGRATVPTGFGLLRRFGLMVAFGNASGAVDPVDPLVLSANGSLFFTRPTLFDHVAERDSLLAMSERLFDWIADGMEVRIGARYPLESAADAHRALEGRATTGKVLIVP